VFDESLRVFDVPYTIFERVAGGPLSLDGDPTRPSPAVYADIGRELAKLHLGVTDCNDPDGRLDRPSRGGGQGYTAAHLEEGLKRTLAVGFLSPASADWLIAAYAHLEPAIQDSAEFRRFLHNDLQPSNVMVNDGNLAAIIDWGDAGWGDPALDFRGMPPSMLPHALAGYREISPLDGDSDAERRILWDQIGLAAFYLTSRPQSGETNARVRPGAILVDLLAFLTSRAGQEWADLLPAG
jgi:aminoglycoside phosphotransferase (APT) family kinase protein